MKKKVKVSIEVDYELFKEILAGLKLAGETFRHYEKCHREKRTGEGVEKAERNAQLAQCFEELLYKVEI